MIVDMLEIDIFNPILFILDFISDVLLEIRKYFQTIRSIINILELPFRSPCIINPSIMKKNLV